MRSLLIISVLSLSFVGFGQDKKEYNYWNRLKSDFFWSGSSVGVYVGPTFGIEKYGLSLGGEIKLYGAYYNIPWASLSIYTNSLQRLVLIGAIPVYFMATILI